MKRDVITSPIRWAGSKKKILNEMLAVFDRNSEIYVEPFLGSGVVLINLINNKEFFKYKKYYVNDINSNIITFYELIKSDFNYLEENVNQIVKNYNSLHNMEEKEAFYYETREKFNQSKCKEKKAIYFWFLMRGGFNGVYRENRKGLFNVPFGKKEKLNYSYEELKKISEFLRNVEFFNMEYNEFLTMLSENGVLKKAFIYFDPPYIQEDKIISKERLYTKNEFKHEEFVTFIKDLKIKNYMISMSESKKSNLIYGNMKKYKINDILRVVNPNKVFKSTEVVFTNKKIIK